MVLTSYLVDTPLDDPLAGSDETDGLISLREAIVAANTNDGFGDAVAGEGGGVVDSIEFADSMIGATITLGGDQLVISESLTLVGLGKGALTISGNYDSRIFQVESGVAAEISGLTLVKGYEGEGGAIYNQGQLKLESSLLEQNEADDAGGAVANLGGTVVLTDVVLRANVSYYQGGAIWSDGTLEIDGSTISDNHSYWEGGGIWNSGTLEIEESSFSNNSTDVFGGGISNREGGTVVIKSSDFVDNQAGSWGGALDSYRGSGPNRPPGSVDVADSTFTGNKSGSGAAIWNDAPGSIVASTFSGNEARSFGGALSQRLGTMTITGSTMSNNHSGSYGGAIDTWATTVILRDSTLSGNSAGRDGGAIENYFATVELINSTITGNSADGVGGAIDNWGGTVTAVNATIVLNRADADGNGSGDGGGIYHFSSTTLLHNTLVGGNVLGAAGNASPNDLHGTVDAASSFNLIGDATTAGGLTHGAAGNIVGNEGSGTLDIANVIDTELANNGGPTLTHALVSDSLAINGGDNALAVDRDATPLEYDQRGPGFVRTAAGTVDIGAFEAPQQVEIDIKPSGDTNPINLASKGVIAVAVLTTETFDAAIVDPDTIQLAGALAEHWAMEDVDGDGDLDLVLHFRVADTNLQQVYAQLLQDDVDQDGSLDSTRQSASITLSGETTSGEQFIGSDVVDLFFSGRALRDFLDEVFGGA